MAHFDINPLDSGELELDPGKSRKLVFNVKNTTGKKVKARVNVLPRDMEPPGSGGKGKDPVSYTFEDKTYVFSPEEQHQLTVTLSASGDAGGRRHGFKLLVYNVDDPNAEFGESEPLSVEVKVPVPPRPVKWKLILALVGGLVLVAGGITAFFFLTQDGEETQSDASDEADAEVAVPEIEFGGAPLRIEQGSAATLRWAVTNAEEVTVTPGVGQVEATGSTEVSPTETTTYTLTATGAETRTSRVTVRVRAPEDTEPTPTTPEDRLTLRRLEPSPGSDVRVGQVIDIGLRYALSGTSDIRIKPSAGRFAWQARGGSAGGGGRTWSARPGSAILMDGLSGRGVLHVQLKPLSGGGVVRSLLIEVVRNGEQVTRVRKRVNYAIPE